MRVVREGLDDVRAGVHELAMQLGDLLGVLEDDLGDEAAGLHVAPALELEQVALRADHGPVVESLEQLQSCPSRYPQLMPAAARLDDTENLAHAADEQPLVLDLDPHAGRAREDDVVAGARPAS